MKIIQHMLYWAKIILPVCCFTACNYLDVVPPETADFDDTMRDKDDAIGFLYSCHCCGGIWGNKLVGTNFRLLMFQTGDRRPYLGVLVMII